LWVPFLAGLTLFGIAWGIRRRETGNHCERCGYDLAGNESEVSPECGAPLTEP
jgi:hypothetical protein